MPAALGAAAVWALWPQPIAVDLATVARFAKIADRRKIQNAIWEALTKFAANYTKREFMAILNPLDVPCGPIMSTEDLATDEHVRGREMYVELDHPQRGKWFNVVSYGVREDDHQLDMEDVAKKAEQHKPKLIIAGGTAYSRTWDWKRFREIADSVGAYLMVDMAHIAGLVAGGQHPSPFPHCHVATTTTHKSLRGPRGGMILTNDEDLAKNHSNGYGADAITGKQVKNAAKSGSIYAYMNLGDMINRLPETILNDHRFEVLASMKGKKGEMEVISSKTTRQKTTYNLTYSFDGTFDNAGKYLLDLVNTAYQVSTTR